MNHHKLIHCALQYDGGEFRQPMQRIISKLILISFCGLPRLCLAQKDNPCPYGPTWSNVGERECYTKAQAALNKRADELVARTVAELRGMSPKEKALYGPVILQSLENAAQKLNDSQVAWRTYRDQYCDAISSYTTGSGSGTAMEECLYRTALARVRQLQRDFPDPARSKGHMH